MPELARECNPREIVLMKCIMHYIVPAVVRTKVNKFVTEQKNLK